MSYKHKLRSRVILASLLSAALLSSLFGISAFVVTHISEMLFIDDTLGQELTHYINRVEQDPSATQVPSRLRMYVTRRGTDDQVPDYLADLEPGTHERHAGENEFHIAIQDRNGKRFYLVYDATHIERWEEVLHSSLLIGVVVFTLIGLWLGFWLSRRVVAPVTQLAEQVRQLSTDPEVTSLSGHYVDDEVGELARSFDEHIRRLHAFMQREAEFTADVSHQLRTPVTVVRTTTELLLSQLRKDDRLRVPLRRLERAGSHMNELIEVFLILAREGEPSSEETCNAYTLEPIISYLLDLHREELERKGLSVKVDTTAKLEARAPCVVLSAVLGNLLGNAIRYTEHGEIRVTLNDHGITISDTGPGISDAEQPHIFQRAYRGRHAKTKGNGLGLAIVKRLCERYGWKIEVESPAGYGTHVRLAFAA